jgi:RNA recognition motif-containing protein
LRSLFLTNEFFVDEFREYFSRFGKVVHGEVMFNRETHKSRGFGFVVFESADAALRACDVREHVIDSKVVEVKLAIPRSKIGSSTPGTPSTGGAIPMMSMLSPPGNTGVRGRTVSMGSGLSPSLPLSGNSSTLAAAQGAHKVGPGILSGNAGSLSLRKPSSSANVVPLTVGGKPVNPSYSGSLRLNNSGIAGPSNEMDEFLGEDPLAGAYVEDFTFEQARPSRALSEPIVRYDLPGNSSNINSLFNNELLSMNSFLKSSPGNSPPFSSAQKVSRGRGINVQQQQPRRSFTLVSSISPEPIGLTNKFFNGGTETPASSNLSTLFFPTNELADSNNNSGSADQGPPAGYIKSPSQQHTLFGSSGSDILFSSPSRDTFGDSQLSSSRQTSITGVGSNSDIWTNSGLSNQTTSESIWANSSSSGFLDNNNASSSGLLGAITAHANYSSRSASKDEGAGGMNPLSSLLQHSSISAWPAGETCEGSGLPTAQRRFSHSAVQSDGFAASTSINLGPGSATMLSELRMNSHEYDIGGQGSGGLMHNNLNNLGNSWGNSGRGF